MASEEESHLTRERRAKVERLRKEGVEPYPWNFERRRPTSEIRARCAHLVPGAAGDGPMARVAGRLRTIRAHGKSAFLDLEDRSGSLQLFCRVDELGEERYRRWLADLDPGDLIGAEGLPMVTRRGEPSLLARELFLLSKALAPPPEKFHGLQDPEERIRRRYVDLLSSEESRLRFQLRSMIVREIRRFLDGEGFLEVETPTLLRVASGAAAQPFVTRSGYLDEELQLRIALELPLKRLLVGGLERVYELGRCFRNEDLDSTHSPEYTSFELYWAYADYNDLFQMMERLYGQLSERLTSALPIGSPMRTAAERFRPPFARIDFVDELERATGVPEILTKPVDLLREMARKIGATVPDSSPPGTFLEKLFDHYVGDRLVAPTFVFDHPAATTPLAKQHRSKPGRIERFEMYCDGFEICNAYTELNDPDEQERRFKEQLKARGIDHYAYDADFVEALRYGLPPATGIGVGIDRLVMALLGIGSIKDVILFPQTRSRDAT